jgi:hypothetical protein
LRLRKQTGNVSLNEVANMGWLELADDASDRFYCVPVYGVPLNHETKILFFETHFIPFDSYVKILWLCSSERVMSISRRLAGFN